MNEQFPTNKATEINRGAGNMDSLDEKSVQIVLMRLHERNLLEKDDKQLSEEELRGAAIAYVTKMVENGEQINPEEVPTDELIHARELIRGTKIPIVDRDTDEVFTSKIGDEHNAISKHLKDQREY